MDGHRDYFAAWTENKGEHYKRISALYNKADKYYHDRFGGERGSEHQEESENSKVIQKQIKDNFDGYISELNDYWEKCEDAREDVSLRKLMYLTKGSILLMEGQYLGERFFDAQRYYHQACVALGYEYDEMGTDLPDLMLQLNLGKYFRSMGKNNQRSDYLRAKDEFEEVIDKIKEKEGKLSPWDTHIWLEAVINIGCAERYLYRLKQAKYYFLNLISLLFKLKNKSIGINDTLDTYLKEPGLYENMRDRLNGDGELYDYYLIKAMVQLSIAYQKSRDYEIAMDLCAAVLRKKPEDVDAANNLGVCLRKLDIKISLADRKRFQKNAGQEYYDNKYLNMSYTDIFESLEKRGNRFASLQCIKCEMDKEKPDKEKIEKKIENLLSKSENDPEVCLLQGIFYKITGDSRKSIRILNDLYHKLPHISKGTIGLKAYDNIADNLLRTQNFREAKKYYEKIEEECERTDDREEESTKEYTFPRFDKNMMMEDLPRGDLIAEIDKSWCLMKLGDYEEAKRGYENIKERYKGMSDRLRTFNVMKINNNLAECYLHLAQNSSDIKRKNLDWAYRILMNVYKAEPNNATTNWHLGHYYKLMSDREDGWEDNLWKSLECFEKAEINKTDEHNFHEAWVSVAVPPLFDGRKERLERPEKLIRKIENKLRYSSGVYSIKSCAKLAKFIKMREREGNSEDGKLEMLYRSLARIRILENDEGYGLFCHFMQNELFSKLKAQKRGELLVALFQLYGEIQSIKEICRYVPDGKNSTDRLPIPVHYTRISTLKKLLPENTETPGRMRLWNTVYMNDFFEGECFKEMMEYVERRRLGNKIDDEAVEDKMKNYFSYANEPYSRQDGLTPINENIFVTSFSEQENAIHMWIPYGDNATGCAITFTEDFFDIRKQNETLTDLSGFSESDYPLYRILYLDENKLQQWLDNGGETDEYEDSLNGDKIPKVLGIMENIWKILDDLDLRLERSDIGGVKMKKGDVEMVRNFAARCLNEVRFLIKSSEYSYEKEMRMLHYSNEPKLDEENFEVPRLYVEVDRDIQIKEVKLGSKIGESQANEIVSWLKKTGKVEKITKSGRHYK